jgi:phage gp36-like protein
VTWATVDDFIGALPGGEAVQISNPPESFAEVPDRDRIQLALTQAAGEILSELGGRFDRAILAASVSADLASIQIAFARWNLDRDVVGRPRDFVYKDAEDRRLRLRRISRGEAALEYTPPEATEPVAGDPTPTITPIMTIGADINTGSGWWA